MKKEQRLIDIEGRIKVSNRVVNEHNPTHYNFGYAMLDNQIVILKSIKFLLENMK